MFPSTFDMTEPLTKFVLQHTSAKIFARESISASTVPGAILAHCPSFFVDYNLYKQQGRGVLNAFRTDHEGKGNETPLDNIDISLLPGTVVAWLNLISRYEEIRTDRAHVMIAAALLGKQVRWRDCGYFKVRAIAETFLGQYDVKEILDDP